MKSANWLRSLLALAILLTSFSAQAEPLTIAITLPDGTKGFFLNREAMEEATMALSEKERLELVAQALELRLSQAASDVATWQQAAKDNAKTARLLGWFAVGGAVVSFGLGLWLGITLAR